LQNVTIVVLFFTTALVLLGSLNQDAFAGIPTNPDKPKDFVADDVSPTQIDLSWNPPDDDGGSPITGYRIEFFVVEDGGTFQVLVSDTGNVNTFSHTGLETGKTYIYRIFSINAEGFSDDPSQAVAKPTSSSTGPPSNLEVFVDEFPFNSFSGAQVVKVVIDDPNISDIDEGKGEPDVKVNNKKLRMVQGIDGKWYAFFSHRDNSLLADSLVAVPGTGQDFGVFCSNISSVLGVTVTETLGFAIKDPSLVTGAINGDASGIPLEGRADCTDPNPTSTPNDFMNVVNGEVSLTPLPSVDMAGQIGIAKGFWAFIQLFLFQINDQVDVTYFVGGTQQTVTLNFVNDPEIGDLDNDGVPDDQDACQGFDDNLDTDKDGIPDGCDPIPELSCGPGTTEVENQCLPDLNQICGQGTKIENMMCVVSLAVGGYFVGIEHSSLLISATQLTASWMIPVIVSGIGIGIVIARKF